MARQGTIAPHYVGHRLGRRAERLPMHRPERTAGARRAWWAALVALRPHQWAKNLLLVLPLLLSHRVFAIGPWVSLGVALAVFCACASAVYLLNDLLDLEADRRHPRKRLRPLASGTLSPRWAMAMIVGLLTVALGVSVRFLSPAFNLLLGAYLTLTTAYSLYLKRTLFLDILVLAGLYTLRIYAGGIVAEVEVSQWLQAFSMFFFVSLALLKRYVELRALAQQSLPVANGRGYVVADLELIQTIGPVSGYLSVLVLCLYISTPPVEALYPHMGILWLVAPVLLYWITRLWLLARREQLADDPVVAALRDPGSYLAGLVCAALVVAASL